MGSRAVLDWRVRWSAFNNSGYCPNTRDLALPEHVAREVIRPYFSAEAAPEYHNVAAAENGYTWAALLTQMFSFAERQR